MVISLKCAPMIRYRNYTLKSPTLPSGRICKQSECTDVTQKERTLDKFSVKKKWILLRRDACEAPNQNLQGCMTYSVALYVNSLIALPQLIGVTRRNLIWRRIGHYTSIKTNRKIGLKYMQYVFYSCLSNVDDSKSCFFLKVREFWALNPYSYEIFMLTHTHTDSNLRH